MANIIKVEPQRLRSAAGELSSTSGQIRNATNGMTSTVTSLSGSIWSGEAANAFVNKFNGLQDEISKIDTMINEHVDDLQRMANEYEKAEMTNANYASSLNDNVF